MAATVVLVHGAWHGAWCWDPVIALLDSAGVASVAVDLPSVNKPGATLHDDADAVIAAIDAVGGPVVLVGHSYGGAVVTDAGAHPAVEHVVYLTAFALDEGESVAANSLAGVEEMTLPAAMVFDGETIGFNPELATDFLYGDCDADAAAAATAKLRPHSAASFSGVPRAIAWREKPSTYVVCTNDTGLPVAMQRSCAERVGTTIDMPADHSPFLSTPTLVADLLVDLATD